MVETINPESSEWMTLTNKYANKCKVCGKEIPVNTKCLWKKGTGVKCLDDCKPELLEAEPPKIITEKEWKDFQKYDWTTLHKITNCQCCGKTLSGNQIHIDDDRRVCSKCF